ncbi:hypothetical protein Csa_023923, partial [Cucumis sativus]
FKFICVFIVVTFVRSTRFVLLPEHTCLTLFGSAFIISFLLLIVRFKLKPLYV